MDNNIFTGIWTNWSRGPVLGPTLTTTKQYGNLIIAFIAVFVGFVASRLWRISCLILHRCYSTRADKNAIHHQRQVILRNSQTPESGLIDTIFLLWAWRKSRTRHVAGLLLLVLFSVCYVVAFTAAGGFSSNISSSIGDEVLINGQNCGIFLPNLTVESSSTYYEWASGQVNSAANYVQQCYRTIESNETTACNKFVHSSIPTYSMNTSAECPFQGRICRNPQSAVRLDSGYIDSHDDLGLNAPRDERFAYRYVLHCAALETDNYTSHVEEGGIGWDRYHYGALPLGTTDNRTGFLDYIYSVEDTDSQYHGVPPGITNSGINFKTSYEHNVLLQGEWLSWQPIPDLVRLGGDLTIVFLSGSGVRFLQKMDDDWYRATTPWGSVHNLEVPGRRTTWRSDLSASPMGCLEQFQWCNTAYPKERGCGPLTSYYDALFGAAPLFNVSTDDLNSKERIYSSGATPSRFIWPMLAMGSYSTSLWVVLGSLGTRSLASQSSLYDGVQSPLPESQWQLDVLQWWHIIMAAVQTSRAYSILTCVSALHAAAVVDTAQGPNDPEARRILSKPLNDYEKNICNSQKIRSSAYTSFSCFGIYFTLITGALIIITSYALEPILNCFHKRRQHKSYTHLEWISNNSLQLHRLAHEQLMGPKWADCADDIPTTDPEVFLANLDISDPEHPILFRPAESKETTEVVKPHHVPAESPLPPDAGALHSGIAADLNGRNSTSSRASVSDASPTLDGQPAIVNVSGQPSLQGSEQDAAGGTTEDAGPGDAVDAGEDEVTTEGNGANAVENSMSGRND